MKSYIPYPGRAVMAIVLIMVCYALATAPASAANREDKADTTLQTAEKKQPAPEKDRQAEDKTITIVADEVTDSEKAEGTAGSVDIIQVNKAYQSVHSVAEVLAERAGVQIKRFGGIGSRSTISIRGTNPNQVAIYIDGIPVTDARTGEVNLEDLPLDNLERIEIYRGFTPARFGLGGIGGVVNLVTKKKKKYSSNIISVSYGSFDTSRLILSRSQKIKKFHYLLFFKRSGSRGNYRFRDNNGTPVFQTWDDRWLKRKNNDHFSYAGTGKFGYAYKTWRFSCLNDFFYKKEGLPGMDNNNILKMNFRTMRNITRLGLQKKKLFLKNISGELSLFYSLKRNSFDNSYGEGYSIGGPSKQSSYSDSPGADLTLKAAFPSIYQSFTLLVSYKRENYRSKDQSYYTSYFSIMGPRQTRDRVTLALEDEFIFFNGILRLAPQLRYEWITQSLTGFGDLELISQIPVAGRTERHNFGGQGGLKIFPAKKYFYLKANTGTGFRNPNFIELFGERGYIAGNTALKPEESFSWDIGCTLKYKKKFLIFSRIYLEYTYFDSTIRNVIAFIQNSQWTMKALNISKARIYGHEASFAVTLFNHLALRGNYTRQWAIDRGSVPYYRNNRLPYRPSTEISAAGKLFFKYGSLSYEFDYQGHNFRDRANSVNNYIKERITHNLSCTGRPVKWLSLTFQVKNITDNRIADIAGYPLPGRAYYGTIAAHFKL